MTRKQKWEVKNNYMYIWIDKLAKSSNRKLWHDYEEET